LHSGSVRHVRVRPVELPPFGEDIPRFGPCHFRFASGPLAPPLVHALDSLVRVTRRVGRDRLARNLRDPGVSHPSGRRRPAPAPRGAVTGRRPPGPARCPAWRAPSASGRSLASRRAPAARPFERAEATLRSARRRSRADGPAADRAAVVAIRGRPGAFASRTSPSRGGHGRAATGSASVTSGSPPAISSAFDPPFEVLFTFPSPYLFAIGLPPVFSLG